MLLVLIILVEKAADPERLSLVRKLNGCRLRWGETRVSATASTGNDKSINSFHPFRSAIFLLEHLTIH